MSFSNKEIGYFKTYLVDILDDFKDHISQSKHINDFFSSNEQKLEVIEKHIEYVKKIQNRQSFEISDKETIDQLFQKYSS